MSGPFIEIGGRPGASFAVSASIANSGTLEKGVYDVWCDVDCRIATERQTPDPALTTSNYYPLFANNVVPVKVGQGQSIYAIAGGAGTLRYIRTGN
jgi:hypothetical protein